MTKVAHQSDFKQKKDGKLWGGLYHQKYHFSYLQNVNTYGIEIVGPAIVLHLPYALVGNIISVGQYGRPLVKWGIDPRPNTWLTAALIETGPGSLDTWCLLIMISVVIFI